MKCTKVLPNREGVYFVAGFTYQGIPRARDFKIEDGKYMVLVPKEDRYIEATWFPWQEIKGCRFLIV